MEHERPDAFINLVAGASRSITKLKSGYMADYGLGSTHTMCLRKLHASNDGLTRTQLSEYCELDKAQVSRIIAELSEKNCVKECYARSGYKRKIVLTEHGERIAEDIDRIMLDVNHYVSGDIPNDQIEIFYRVFEQICDKLKCADQIPEKTTDNYERK